LGQDARHRRIDCAGESVGGRDLQYVGCVLLAIGSQIAKNTLLGFRRQDQVSGETLARRTVLFVVGKKEQLVFPFPNQNVWVDSGSGSRPKL